MQSYFLIFLLIKSFILLLMKKIQLFASIVLVMGVLLAVSCKKKDTITPEEFVQDKPHDKDVIGYWIGYADVTFKTVNGELILDVTDTSTIYPAVNEYKKDGSDFSYRLKKENGHYIHSYDPNSKISLNYWYTGVSGNQKTLYDVFSIGGADPSSTIDFDYQVYNTDTLIIHIYSTDEKRLLVRIADPSKIPSGLKIKE